MITLRCSTTRHPNFEPPAELWNELAWMGSLYESAQKVVFAAEKAIQLEPDELTYRDTRGLVRARSGNRNGAIEDFEAYIAGDSISEESMQLRREWVESLQGGRDPFTPDVLNKLKRKTLESLQSKRQ
jgi:hypothetical protein